MELRAIGVIHSPYVTKDACPIQPVYASEARGTVEVFEEYAAGLKDVETFSHLYLLYLFDRAGQIELVRPTFLDDEPHGVFASRHPCRPNGIGMSIVRLTGRPCWTSSRTSRGWTSSRVPLTAGWALSPGDRSQVGGSRETRRTSASTRLDPVVQATLTVVAKQYFGTLPENMRALLSRDQQACLVAR